MSSGSLTKPQGSSLGKKCVKGWRMKMETRMLDCVKVIIVSK